MQADLANGQLWLFQDVLVGRCDADIFESVRAIDVRCSGQRPKVLRRLRIELESGGRALVVLCRCAVASSEVSEVEVREAEGRVLARLAPYGENAVPVAVPDALLQGMREADALEVLRAILATSRIAGWDGTGESFATISSRVAEFLSQPREGPAAAVRTAARRKSPTGKAPVGGAETRLVEAETAVLLDHRLLLFKARAPWPLAPLGQAWTRERDAKPTPVQCLGLEQASDETGAAFIGMLHLPGTGAEPPEQLTLAIEGRRLRVQLGTLQRDRGDWLLAMLQGPSAAAAPRVADFLAAHLSRRAEGVGPVAEPMLLDLLLEQGSAHGVVEIVGVLPGYGLYVQGWSRSRLGTYRRVVHEGQRCHFRRALFATFRRDDLGGEGSGFVGLIEAPDLPRSDDLCRIHLREETCWSHLELFEQGQRLPAEVTRDHLRAMLPRLEDDAETLRRFRRIANGGFDGRDTLSTLERPVRIGLDFAMLAEGTGAFLGGWLLDPTGIIDCLTLRSTAGMAVDLTQHWTRTARPDLNEAFGADPLFAPHLSSDAVRHGFMAFVPRPSVPGPDEDVYLEVVLTDDSVHFLPLVMARRPDASALRRLLGSFDRNDPAASRLIERQIGPFVAATGYKPAPQSDQVDVLDPAKPARLPLRSVIVPLGPTQHDFDVNLASFAVDRDFALTQIVAVAPAALGGPAISALWHQAGFYGLDLRLVVTRETLDPCAALEVGAEHAGSDILIFLSSSTFGRTEGWLGELCRTFGDLGRPALLSPTLLYEDDSIKFAGYHQQTGSALQPAEAPTSAFAGYPRGWLQGEAPTPVLAATAECCILSRDTLRRIGGFSPEFVTPELKSSDFMLKGRQVGIPSYWLPTVEMVALDERFDHEGAYWFRNRLVVDDWSFGRKWSDHLAASREAA